MIGNILMKDPDQRMKALQSHKHGRYYGCKLFARKKSLSGF